MPFSIGSGSRSAITTLAAQSGQAYFGRMCSRTTNEAGTYSSCSRISSPMRRRGVPQSGHGSCSAGTSCRIGFRARLAAVALLLGLGRTRRGCRRRDRLGSRLGLGLGQDLLGEEQEPGGVDPLALPAVALAEELFDLVLELGVEVDLLGERLQQLADELMGRLEVVGEWSRRADHTP